MAKAVNNNFHWMLLALIPVVFLLGFLNKDNIADLQWQDTALGATMRLDVALSIMLFIKAALYYLTRNYHFSKRLCYFDVAMTAVACGWSFFRTTTVAEGEVLAVDLNLTLLIVLWGLVQFFVFINFFVHLLIRSSKGVEYK